jgi:DNA mismatch repair protein MutS
MGLSGDFIKGTNQVLSELTKSTIVTTKSSNYNSQVFMDECKVCKGVAEETHHIKEQHTADRNDMIDHHHKNTKHNLVPLCKVCHANVTYGRLTIYGWKQTSRGKLLDYEKVTQPKKQSSMYSEEQLRIIMSYKDKVNNETLNKTTCINLIDSKYGFRPSIKELTRLFRVNSLN